MEIVSVEVFITKQYIFKKDDITYSCLVEIKNNQVTNVNITSSDVPTISQDIIEEIKSLITI
jgi:hypothetical protein